MVIRTTSHRARHRMISRLGRSPLALFSFELGSGFYEITEDEAKALFDPEERRIPGVTRARVKREKLSKCWGGDSDCRFPRGVI